MSETHKYFFGQHPAMPWKQDLWAVVANKSVDGWEAGERRFITMDEYQRLIRLHKDTFVLDGVKESDNAR
jgi:hypothetical protein